MISKRNQHMETMKLKDLKQKRFTFFIFQAVKCTWISLIRYLFNITSLENLLNLSMCVFSKLLAMDSFFSFCWFSIWIDLIADWSLQIFLLKVIFQREKERRKFRVLLFVTVYIFIYLQRESAVGSLSKFLAQKVRCQRFIY